MRDTKAEIRAILAEQMAILETAVGNTASLKQDLGLDSLDFVELVMELEERHGWAINDRDAQALQGMTVEDLIAYVEKRDRGAA